MLTPLRTVQWLDSATRNLMKPFRPGSSVRRRRKLSLPIDALEDRMLLTVSTLSETWKQFMFQGPVKFEGKFSGTDNGQEVKGSFQSDLTLNGSIDYSSSAVGGGTGGLNGTITPKLAKGGPLSPIAVNASTNPGGLQDQGGLMSFDFPATGGLGALTIEGDFKLKKSSLSGKSTFSFGGNYIATGKLSGTLATINPQPLNVDVTAQWSPVTPGVVNLDVLAEGSVQNVKKRSTPVAFVNFFWGNQEGTQIGKLPDVIPVLWNQAGGTYHLSGLPTPPAEARKLIVTTNYGDTVKSVLLDLPPLPEISINNSSISPPTSGYVQIVFTVSLNTPANFPVEVHYKTIDGTAVQDDDYQPVSGVLRFEQGESVQQILIEVKRDEVVANQDFYLQLELPLGGTIIGTGRGTGSIIDIP